MSDQNTPDTPTPNKPSPAEITPTKAANVRRGPATIFGKARSALNATRHGLYSRKIVLPEESRSEFQALLGSYIEQYQPTNTHEYELVSIMAATRWRLDRLVSIETSLIAHHTDRRREDVDRYVPNATNERITAWIFDYMSSGTALPLIPRYESTLTRTYDRAFKQLQILRAGSSKPAKKDTPTTERIRVSDSPDETNSAI